MKNKQLYVFTLIWTGLLAAIAAAGVTLLLVSRTGLAGTLGVDGGSRYRRLEQVRTYLMEEYYEPLDEEALMTGAIRGMMDAADDPYTFYYTAQEMEQTNQSQSGIYHGVGMIVQLTEENAIEIIHVYDDTPAQAAGVQPGDVLLAVDGQAVETQTQADYERTIGRIRGEDGTQVILTVRRGDETLDLSCTRGEVTISHVTVDHLGDDIGYLRITQFSGDDESGALAALEQFRREGVRGVVLDLRNNPGGLLDHVVHIADAVLPEGLITYYTDRHGNRSEERSGADYWDVPMVVLVNGASASGSELFSAAFQDYERGLVVGTTTYGKGIMQTVITFPEDGAGLQLTTAAYYSPKGRSIHKVGVQPDIEVELDDGVDISVLDPETDNQLAAALEALDALIDDYSQSEQAAA